MKFPLIFALSTFLAIPITASGAVLAYNSTVAAGAANGNLITFVSSTAIPATATAGFANNTLLDGVINQTGGAGSNGPVFDLPGTLANTGANAMWVADISPMVNTLVGMNFYNLVGRGVDNGVEDFTVEFFDAPGGTGNLISSQSFTAILNTGNTPEVFDGLGGSAFGWVERPRSFKITTLSSFGNQGRAEFSEITFQQIPEPSRAILLTLGALCLGLRRRR